MAKGSRVRLKQPKLPEGTWDITVWDAPTYFEYRQKSGGITSVAGHRVEALEEGRSRLTLSLDMRGLLIPGRPVLQGHDQPLHDQRGSGHEARRSPPTREARRTHRLLALPADSRLARRLPRHPGPQRLIHR